MSEYKSVYLIGSRGLDGSNELAEKVEQDLLILNMVVCNPEFLDWSSEIYGEQWCKSIRGAMKMMLTADCVQLIKGWKKSKTAVIELGLALNIGLPAYYPCDNNYGYLSKRLVFRSSIGAMELYDYADHGEDK